MDDLDFVDVEEPLVVVTEEEIVASVAEEPPVAAPAAPGVPEVPVVPAVPEVPVAPVAQEPEPAPAVPVAAVPEAQPSASTPEPQVGIVEQLTQNRDVLIEALAAERFALTKEEEEAIETDAIAAIPKLLAKTFYEATTAALKHIQNHVPGMIAQQAQTTQVAQHAETTFFTQFPGLTAAAHGNDIVLFANSFKASDPKITSENLNAMVGAAVMAKHGIAAGASPPVPVAPTPKQQPFSPAKPGTQVQIVPEPEHAFAGLDPNTDHDGGMV